MSLNIQMLERRLAEVVIECGGETANLVEVRMDQKPELRASNCQQFLRQETPLKLFIEVRAMSAGSWQPTHP